MSQEPKFLNLYDDFVHDPSIVLGEAANDLEAKLSPILYVNIRVFIGSFRFINATSMKALVEEEIYTRGN